MSPTPAAQETFSCPPGSSTARGVPSGARIDKIESFQTVLELWKMLFSPETSDEMYEKVVYKLAGKSFVELDWKTRPLLTQLGK